MKSIAVTKPDMGVLSREQLPLSPFGALAQAFAEELLARAEWEEGVWPFVPLELLEEFYEKQNGQTMGEEQRAFARGLMEQIWEENRV